MQALRRALPIVIVFTALAVATAFGYQAQPEPGQNHASAEVWRQ